MLYHPRWGYPRLCGSFYHRCPEKVLGSPPRSLSLEDNINIVTLAKNSRQRRSWIYEEEDSCPDALDLNIG
jgi:hypothetical protein